jgi:hypothetical protein
MKIVYFSSRSLVFFHGAGDWTQGFMLTKQVLYCFSLTSSPFCSGYFGGGVWKTICPGWLRTTILLISASQVARLTGLSYWCLAMVYFLSNLHAWLFTSTVFHWLESTEGMNLCSQISIRSCQKLLLHTFRWSHTFYSLSTFIYWWITLIFKW